MKGYRYHSVPMVLQDSCIERRGVSIWDAAGHHPEEGGSIPTTPLHEVP